MIKTNPIFSDDRGEYLEHYGVKGMKWHQHLKARTELATDIAEAKREWSEDKGLHKVMGITKATARSVQRNKLGTAGGYFKERGRIAGLHILSARHQRNKGKKKVDSVLKKK